MMRLGKSVISVLLLLILLASCSTSCAPGVTKPDNKEPQIVYDDTPVSFNRADTFNVIQYSDGILYLLSYQSGNGRRFMRNMDIFKYNCATGRLTYVCTDPVCEHSTPDCPLYGALSFYPCNGRLFINKSYQYNHLNKQQEIFRGFASYDMQSGELKKLEIVSQETAEQPSIQYRPYVHLVGLFAEGYRFYYEDGYKEQLDAYVKMLKRMNLDTGEITVIDDSSNTAEGKSADMVSYLFCVDGRLYLSDLKTLFSTDLNYQDKKIIAEGLFDKDTVSNGKVMVWRDSETHELYAMNMDGSDRRALGIKAHSFNLNEKNLYYCSDDSISIGYDTETKTDTVLNGKELYRYSFDSGKSELLLSFDGEYEYTRLLSDDWVVVNNCLYARYYKWTLPDSGRLVTSRDRYLSSDVSHVNTILRADLASGEISLIELAIDG